jgi:uncharacterized delta-60 repeat protein
VARFLPNGTLDPSFGGGDGILTGGGTTQGSGHLLVDTDGSLLFTTYDQITLGHFGASLVRINAAGTSARYLAGTDDDSSFGDIALQADRKIVVGGDRLRRFLPDGREDPAFSADATGAAEVAVQPDGRIVTVGSTNRGGGDDLDWYVDRHLPNGALDPSFSGDGIATVDVGDSDGASGLALQPDGDIVVAGATGNWNAELTTVVRFKPDGTRDAAFGSAGVRRFPFPGTTSGGAADVLLQGDGKIVVGGTAGGDFAVARLWGDPVASCGGLQPTIAGGEALVMGTDAADVIAGSAGPDRILGGNGNDVICGGAGNDHLYGGPANDKLFGGAGTDFGDGGLGTDTASEVETLVSVP